MRLSLRKLQLEENETLINKLRAQVNALKSKAESLETKHVKTKSFF